MISHFGLGKRNTSKAGCRSRVPRLQTQFRLFRPEPFFSIIKAKTLPFLLDGVDAIFWLHLVLTADASGDCLIEFGLYPIRGAETVSFICATRRNPWKDEYLNGCLIVAPAVVGVLN